MTSRWSRLAVAATMVSIALPGVAARAETQVQAQAQLGRDARSPELRARLHDGRLAMIRESLKLNEAQMKLWEPVEAQLRSSFDARQKLRAERRGARERGPGERPSLAERLDRRSQRLTERAEHAKGLADAFRPFYASLSDDQKTVAGVVMRRAVRGGDGHGWRHHGFMRRAPGPEQD
jgi:LTXXQ motif family protein